MRTKVDNIRVALAAMAIALGAATAMAVPACPDAAAVTQPDGTSITLQRQGDEFLHFTTTADGYTVVKGDDGYYFYAVAGTAGTLTASTTVARNPGDRSQADEEFLATINRYITPSMTATGSEMRSSLKSTTSARPKLNGYSTYDLSKLRGLVLLVEYNDCSFTRSNALEIFTDMVTQKDYEGVPSASNSSKITTYTGSVRDYYYENSAGAYDATFDVYGPVTIDYSKTYVQATTNARTIMKAACEAADSLIDYSNYDSDNDGYVDFVFFIFAGNGSNYSGNDDDLLWPHAWTMTNCTLDGKTLYRYACSVELYGTSSSTLDGIGTICHEYSHVLGLADLYDTDYEESGGQSVHPGYWSVMASGCYCNYGRTPTGYSLYERYALGFVSPAVVDSAGTYSMRSLEDYNEGYRINSAVDDEYFLLENRRKSGWNAYTAGSGMLVWRVDSTNASVWEGNTVNCNPDHNYYELVRANPNSTSSAGSDSDPFPGTNNVTSLTNETSPSIASWTGKETPFIISNISESSDDVITITVEAAVTNHKVEKFEDIGTFSGDSTGVAGVYATWDFSSACVMECSSSSSNNVAHGYGSHTAAIYKDGSITSSALVAEGIDTVFFYAWNSTSRRTGTMHLYYSTDGGNQWIEAYEAGATSATTISAGTSEQLLSYPLGLSGTAAMIRITADGDLSSRFICVDNVSVVYSGTFGVIGEGTASSPFTVSDCYQWNALAQYMVTEETSLSGQYVKVTADIDFTGYSILPLGHDRTVVFDGDLDGGGHSMSGIAATADAAYYGPVAIKAGEDAVIHDLTVEGTVTSSYICAAGVVGQLDGTLSNVTSRIAVTSTANYTAGIAGYATESSVISGCVNEGAVTSSGGYTSGILASGYHGAQIADCVNNGTITYTGTSTSSCTAGIAGYVQYVDIERCVNNGTITATNEGAGGLAGILGYAYSSSSSSYLTSLTSCSNNASITSSCNNAGIVLTGSTSAAIAVDDCHNTGDITSTSTSAVSSTYTAGIAASYFRGSTYTGCTNSGDITSLGSPYAAGLFGYYRGSALSESSRTEISDCHNTGNISVAGNYAAGVVAYASNYMTIDSCSNEGSVTASGSYAGGIAGYFTGTQSSISACLNGGSVTAGENYAGGLIGYGASQNSVDCCFSTGDVTAAQYAGGIAGQAVSAFSDVYTAGNILAATDYAAGLIGCSSSSSTTISRGYTIATVACGGSNCGGITGDGAATLDTVYHLADSTSGTAITCQDLAKISLGSAWADGDSYTYPRLATMADNDYARAHAAAVVPAEGDTYSSITANFNLGEVDGVVWTASDDVVSIEGNTATFLEDYTGTLTMTATAGEVSVATTLVCDVDIDGVAGVTAGARQAVAERYYTPSGILIGSAPASDHGIYIVVSTYDDGTTQAEKQTLP